MQKKRYVVVAALTTLILLIPFVAMQFTEEVNWQVGDFLIGGSLIFAFLSVGSWIFQKNGLSGNRLLWAIGVIILIVLLWIELAVGVFGTPFAGS